MPPNKQDEANEYPFAGPFPGLQSEVAPSQIGNAGFAEIQNLILRNSTANIIPEFTPVAGPSPDGTPIMGTFDFYNVNGDRQSGVFTRTGMYNYGASSWIKLAPKTSSPAAPKYDGVNFTGASNQYFQEAVVGYKLYFSQQSDPVQVWDGIATTYQTANDFNTQTWPPGYSPTEVQPVPAKYLMELDFHLIVGNTSEAPSASNASGRAPNRVHWSAAGNGMDWTSFSAGQNDLYNDLGPITGMTRLFQTGYVFQKWGVTQMVPTGQALAPFAFISMGAYAKGNTFPYTLAAFGEQIAVYIAKDDVYVFDGTSSQAIGQHPIDGNRRLGARTRIFHDLFLATPDNVWGAIMTSANGNTYESYWLFIPSLNKCWIYNFDESNWTQTFFEHGRLNGPVAVSFVNQGAPRIIDLVGNMTAQNWSAATLAGGSPLDAMVIADNTGPLGATNAPTVSYLNFGRPAAVPTMNSINSLDGWYIRSGPLDFDDNRHPHTVNKVRLVLTDVANQMQFYIRLTNEAGYQTPVQLVTTGTGTGTPITIMVDLRNGITGKYITWELSGPQGVLFQLVEVTPYPVVGGEVMSPCSVVVSPPSPTPPSPPPPTITVSISPGSASLAPGATQQFTPTVTGSAITTVTWNASQGSITTGGLFTAPSVTSATVVTITATSVADPTVSAIVSVSVQPAGSVITVTVTPSGGTVTSAGTMQFTQTVTGTSNVAVTWTASPGTISSTGLYTAPTVTVAENAIITATSVADLTKSASVTISVQPPTGTSPIDVLTWVSLNQRASQHLAGDPHAPYSVQVMNNDPLYPSTYPANTYFQIKNKLGNPWDIRKYDNNYIYHWITEDGDSVDNPLCQTANGTTCWLYARAYKRFLTPLKGWPRYLTPGTPVTIDSPGPNTTNRTVNCETSLTGVITLGDVKTITSGPFKYTWGGNIDHGAGTGANGPTLDSVNGVDTIKNEYYYSGTIAADDFKDREEYYIVQGFGEVAWYYYHRSSATSPWVWQNQTVNSTLASGGAPAPNFPCGAGKPWWV